MTDHILAISPRLLGRIAGLLYLIIIAAGSAGYITYSALTVPGDAAATAANILASEQMWRLGLGAMLVMLAFDVALAAVFYVLFRPVSRTLSLVGFGFRLVMAAILGVAVLTRSAPLLLLEGIPPAAFGPEQARALGLLAVELFDQDFDVALVFFGFHCFVIGWLIYRSGFLPRILGVLLAGAGLGYLANSFANLVFPWAALPFAILLAAFAVELALALWLTAFGVNAGKWNEQAGAIRAGQP